MMNRSGQVREIWPARTSLDNLARSWVRDALASVLGLLLLLVPAFSAAQDTTAAGAPGVGMRPPPFVGSDAERQLRILQTLGEVPTHPWSIRGFSMRELDGLITLADTQPGWDHPELRARRGAPVAGWSVVPPRLESWYNAAFPHGHNDGPTWRGRGLTIAASGGIALRWRPVSIVLAPHVFWAENRAFPLWGNTYSDPVRLEGRAAEGIDKPQRFGDRPYGAIDPGQSTLRLDLPVITAGVSTANVWSGPMAEFPFLLGTNAPGFLHAFAGSSSPWNIGIGHVHGRVIYARLEQSAFSSMPADEGTRLATALIGVFTPRGLHGLEIGASRFHHAFWPERVTREHILRPFSAVLKNSYLKRGTPQNPEAGDTTNQLASVFFRWVLPRSGFEAYGEFGREDHNTNVYDLVQEPDHTGVYGLGLAHSSRTRDGILTVRGELMNFRSSSLDLQRPQNATYTHYQLRQGHTHRGQLLGAGVGFGSGAGSVVTVEHQRRYDGWRASWTRFNRSDLLGRMIPTGDPNMSVQHALTAERRTRRGPLEVTGGLTGIYELNRHLRADVGSAEVALRLRWVGAEPR